MEFEYIKNFAQTHIKIIFVNSIRNMLFAVESETIGNFMLYAFGFIVIFGYWVYRLAYKWMDHVTHTQRIDQYAKHFVENKHLVSSFGQNIYNFLANSEYHLYIYSMCSYIVGTSASACKSVISPVMNYINNRDQRSTVANAAEPVITALSKYLSGLLTISPSSRKSTRSHKYNKHNRPIGLRKRQKRCCVPMFNGNDDSCQMRPIAPKCPVRIAEYRRHPFVCPIKCNYCPGYENCSLSSFTSVHAMCEKFICNLALDLKSELGNNPCINTYIDSVVRKINSYEWTNLTTYVNLADLYSFIMMDRLSIQILSNAISTYISDRSQNPHLLKDIFRMFDEVERTRVLPNFSIFYEFSLQLISKYAQIPIESIPRVDPGIISIGDSIVKEFNSMMRILKLGSDPIQTSPVSKPSPTINFDSIFNNIMGQVSGLTNGDSNSISLNVDSILNSVLGQMNGSNCGSNNGSNNGSNCASNNGSNCGSNNDSENCPSTLRSINFPSINSPSINFPSINFPSINFPSITSINFSFIVSINSSFTFITNYRH